MLHPDLLSASDHESGINVHEWTQERVLITGGTRGVGRALAERLLGLGAMVVVTGSSAESVRRAQQAGLTAVLADAGDATSGVAARLLERVPGGPTTVILNAATQSRIDVLRPDAAERAARELAVDLMGPVALALAALPGLDRVGGRLVFVSTVLARVPQPAAPTYSGAKAGMEAFLTATLGQLRVAGSSVRVQTLVLPLVDTAMTAGRGSGKLSPADAAERMVAEIERGRPRAAIGRARIALAIERLSPALARRVVLGTVVATPVRTEDDSAAPPSATAGEQLDGR